MKKRFMSCDKNWEKTAREKQARLKRYKVDLFLKESEEDKEE